MPKKDRNFVEKSLAQGEHGPRARVQIHKSKTDYKREKNIEQDFLECPCGCQEYFCDGDDFWIPKCKNCKKIMQEVKINL